VVFYLAFSYTSTGVAGTIGQLCLAAGTGQKKPCEWSPQGVRICREYIQMIGGVG
jgi:hypothetical protein